MSYRVAVLTISDTAAADDQYDKSGPLIKERLAATPCYDIIESSIVPDDKDAISRAVLTFVHEQKAALLLTTGGTGFGPRDVTPEAVSPLLQRHASGIQHLLLSASLKHTPLAALSRLVAGTISNSLVITLPGSPKAAQECLDSLLENGVLEHALQLINGTDSRKLHEELGLNSQEHQQQSTDSHDHRRSHSHPHHIHIAPTPKSSVSQRPRHSRYPIAPLAEAHNLILSKITPLPAVKKKVGSSLRGHVLAETIISAHNIPSLPSSNVDGYALKSSQQPGTYEVLHPLNHSLDKAVPPNHIYRINTGAPLPRGADAVIMVEDTSLVSELDDAADIGSLGEERQVQTLVAVNAGENVRQPGSDVRQGDKIFDCGDALGNTGGDIGALAFIGRRKVSVFRKPVVAIMSTGDELHDLRDTETGNDGWRSWDTNRPTLRTALEGLGYTVFDLGIVKDSIDAHVKAFKDAFAHADILVSTGGSSMGTSDFMKTAMEKLQGLIHFGRVKVKPGKPTIFAQIPAEDGLLKPVFALPGNPASALTTFYLFVLPALRLMGGHAKNKCQLPRIKVQLAESMALDSRPEFHRAHLRPNLEGMLLAYSTGGQRSSRAISLSGANALIALPSKEDEGRLELGKGEMADAILIDF